MSPEERKKVESIFRKLHKRLGQEMQSIKEIEGEIQVLFDLFKIVEIIFNIHLRITTDCPHKILLIITYRQKHTCVVFKKHDNYAM